MIIAKKTRKSAVYTALFAAPAVMATASTAIVNADTTTTTLEVELPTVTASLDEAGSFNLGKVSYSSDEDSSNAKITNDKDAVLKVSNGIIGVGAGTYTITYTLTYNDANGKEVTVTKPQTVILTKTATSSATSETSSAASETSRATSETSSAATEYAPATLAAPDDVTFDLGIGGSLGLGKANARNIPTGSTGVGITDDATTVLKSTDETIGVGAGEYLITYTLNYTDPNQKAVSVTDTQKVTLTDSKATSSATSETSSATSETSSATSETSKTSSATSETSSATSETSSATSEPAYKNITIAPDKAMTEFLDQATKDGITGNMVATLDGGIQTGADGKAISKVFVNSDGSVVTTAVDPEALSGEVVTTFTNGMVLTSTIKGDKMTTLMTTQPTSKNTDTSSATSDTSSATSETSSTASSATSETSSTASETSSASSSNASNVSSAASETSSVASNTSSASSSNASNVSSATSETSSVASETNNSDFVITKDGKSIIEINKDMTKQEIAKQIGVLMDKADAANVDVSDLLQLYQLYTDGMRTFDGSSYSDSEYNNILDSVKTVGQELAKADPSYQVFENGNNVSEAATTPSNTSANASGSAANASVAKTLPQTGEADGTKASVIGMAMVGAISLTAMIGEIKRRHAMN